MKHYYFNIHNIIKIKVTFQKFYLFKKFFLNTYDYFKVNFIESNKIDLHIIISNFKPDLNGCIKMDDKFYAKKDFLFFTEKYKFAKFNTAIINLKGPNTKVIVSGNTASELVWPTSLIIPILKYLAAQKGYCCLHAAGIVKNNKAVILAGRSGTGKSRTLFKALARGFKILGDDVTLIDGDKKVMAMPFPLHIRYTYPIDEFIKKRLNISSALIMNFKKLLSRITLGHISLFTRLKAHETFKNSVSGPTEKFKIYLIIPGEKFGVLNTAVENIKKSLTINNLFEESDIDKYIAYQNYASRSEYMPYQKDLVRNIINKINPEKFTMITIPAVYTRNTENRLFEFIEKDLQHDHK